MKWKKNSKRIQILKVTTFFFILKKHSFFLFCYIALYKMLTLNIKPKLNVKTESCFGVVVNATDSDMIGNGVN